MERLKRVDPLLPLTGSDEGYSLKDTVVRHPYLFENSSVQVSQDSDLVGNLRKKAISSECLLSINDDAPIAQESIASEIFTCRNPGVSAHAENMM